MISFLVVFCIDGADIVFLVDSSVSGRNFYLYFLQLIVDVVRLTSLSPDGFQAGAHGCQEFFFILIMISLSFSGVVYFNNPPDVILNLTSTHDVTMFQLILENSLYPLRSASAAPALRAARSQIFGQSSSGTRGAGCKKMVVMLTNAGPSADSEQTMAEAGLLHAAGVDVIVAVAADNIFSVNFAEMQLLTNNTPQNLLFSFQWSTFLQQITQPLIARLNYAYSMSPICFLLWIMLCDVIESKCWGPNQRTAMLPPPPSHHS